MSLAPLAALLAMLVVVLATPGHVLEESAGIEQHRFENSAAFAQLAPAAPALAGHHVLHHVCVDHCAVHGLSDNPRQADARPPTRVAQIWLAGAPRRFASLVPSVPRPPPRA